MQEKSSAVSRSPFLPIETVKAYLRSVVPDWEWFLEHLRLHHGWLPFPSFVVRSIRRLKVQNYPLLYENEKSLLAVGLLPFFSPSEIRELGQLLQEASLEERGEIVQLLLSRGDEYFSRIQIPKTRSEYMRVAREFRSLPIADQQKATKDAQFLLSGFLAGFHQLLSLMLHGEKLSSLVAQAKAGDRSSYMRAIQVDSQIFFMIPYFQKRFSEARYEGDQEFCDAVGYRLRSAPYRGKIQHKSLWLSFALLDWLGWFDVLTDREMLELLDEAQVGALTGGVSDVVGLGKCRRQYRSLQSRNALPMQ